VSASCSHDAVQRAAGNQSGLTKEGTVDVKVAAGEAGQRVSRHSGSASLAARCLLDPNENCSRSTEAGGACARQH
jgi:hypothetical protein